MRIAGAALAAAMFATTSAAETMVFGIIPVPDETDVRMQVIERQPTEEWPFSVDRGVLVCIPILRDPTVYFGADDDTDRVMLVTVDPIEAWMDGLTNHGLLTLEGTLGERTRAMIPYVEMGRRLCDLDAGTSIGPGET